MVYALGDGMRTIIQRATGMSVEEIDRADHETIHRSIEKKIGHKLELGLVPGRLSSGNVLIDAGRIITPEEIERAWGRPSFLKPLVRLIWLYIKAPANRALVWLFRMIFYKPTK